MGLFVLFLSPLLTCSYDQHNPAIMTSHPFYYDVNILLILVGCYKEYRDVRLLRVYIVDLCHDISGTPLMKYYHELM